MRNNTSLLTELILQFSWPEIIGTAWKYAKKVIRGYSNEGIYEVLNYESTLELMNSKGTRAKFSKEKHIKYLQDNIIAYQDYAWGDGEILQNYRCSPGKPVDQYRLGYKTYILLSLGTVRNRGEKDEFHFQWEIKDGFLNSEEFFWETDITQPTTKIKTNIIFPRSRPPQKVTVIETNHRRTHLLGNEYFTCLPDGRIEVSWEKQNPRLFEHYLVRWEW